VCCGHIGLHSRGIPHYRESSGFIYVIYIYLSIYLRGATNRFQEYPQDVDGVLSHGHSCIQERADMFQLVFIRATDQTGHSFPSCRGSMACPFCNVGHKMNYKNVEQRINMTFCVRIGKSTNDMLALLTLASDEYAI
jgi:hypothetical protein